ncbi:MAG: translation initiation factor [Sulfurimonadaceae bacterium]|nr:translation initiation factor [Sulfurimonadaceae bacterium]
MGRGTKLDLNIGASFNEGWQQVEDIEETAGTELLEPSKHRLVFKMEKRRGKPVTLTGPFSLEKKEADAVLKRLKKKLGCGGSYKEGWMEFQGDIAPKLRPLLSGEGFGLKS